MTHDLVSKFTRNKTRTLSTRNVKRSLQNIIMKQAKVSNSHARNQATLSISQLICFLVSSSLSRFEVESGSSRIEL